MRRSVIEHIPTLGAELRAARALKMTTGLKIAGALYNCKRLQPILDNTSQ